ncbi:MAG: transposase [Betaproteobacteria bacterium]|jgi:transposase|nr:transposase [Betaproteobacteria bacterium]
MLDDGTVPESRKAVRRTPAERAAIVAETYQPGATVAGVAHEHAIAASQLSSWRTAAKRLSGMEKASAQSFTAIAVVPDGPSPSLEGVEIAVGAVSVRLPKNTTPKRIADIACRLAQAR